MLSTAFIAPGQNLVDGHFVALENAGLPQPSANTLESSDARVRRNVTVGNQSCDPLAVARDLNLFATFDEIEKFGQPLFGFKGSDDGQGIILSRIVG